MNVDRERAELKVVLASTLFGRAPDLSKFLRYVCEKHFSNRADEIKEYSIAVEALGRSPDFRPDVDSIVRVQAARVRKHLRRYYETDGADHALQIRISPTGYRPEFIHVVRQEDRAAEAAEEQDSNHEAASCTAGAPTMEEPGISLVPGEPAPDDLREPETGLRGQGAAPQHRSLRKLIFTLVLVATAVIIAGVGLTVKRQSVERPILPASTAPAAAPAEAGIRIRAGLADPTYLDASGSQWLSDRYYTGGVPFRRTGGQILRTLDQALYQGGRRGTFSYAVPLPQGVYELHLHFAEAFWGLTVGADTQRLFHVSVNGTPLLTWFDIAKDAGGVYIADQKIFKDVSPGIDGLLRLDFSSGRGSALLNAFEVLSGVSGKMLPVRIVCSTRPRHDKHGQLWKTDQYFSGGRIAELTDPIEDPNLGGFWSYRTGNFNYAIPVAEGIYRVRLIFAEPVFGRDAPAEQWPGRRVFDVYCNGKTILGGFDILSEARGWYRVIEKTFRDVKPDAQGKILLSFVPVRDYAVLLAIEVLDESW